jgi:hypothetical protein
MRSGQGWLHAASLLDRFTNYVLDELLKRLLRTHLKSLILFVLLRSNPNSDCLPLLVIDIAIKRETGDQFLNFIFNFHNTNRISALLKNQSEIRHRS